MCQPYSGRDIDKKRAGQTNLTDSFCVDCLSAESIRQCRVLLILIPPEGFPQASYDWV